VKCRAPTISQEAIDILYGVEGLLYYLTQPGPVNPPTIPDITAWMNSINANSTFNTLTMPSTCTYDYWKTNQFCAVRYTGLQSLTGLDITLSAQAIKCTNSPIPAFYLGCKGTDCFLGNRFKLCDSDKDCTLTTKCTNLFNISQYESNPYNNSYSCTNCSTGIGYSASLGIAFTPALYLSYYSKTSQCYDIDKDPSLLAKDGLRYMEGLPADMSNTNTLFMCAPDPDVIKKQNATQWAMDQAVVSGTTILMKDLHAWTVSKAPVVSPGTTGGGGGGGKGGSSTGGVMNVVVSIISILMVLLM
jgi:hypothetical protein